VWRFVLVLLVSTSLLAVGISAPRLKEPPVTDLHFPTTVGAKWVYACRDGIDNFEMVREVTKVEDKDGGMLVTIEREINGVKGPDSKMVVSSKGLLKIESRGEAINPPVWALKLPAKPGLTWGLPPGFQDKRWDGDFTYTTREQERVEVPAGRFWAVPVDIVEADVRDPSRTTCWYAPGVGLTKRTGGSTHSQVLKSFVPAK
jgi:hypothetical protein